METGALFNFAVMKKLFLLLSIALVVSCGKKTEKIKPVMAPITESIYASGTVKSKDQYQAFATVNGIVETRFVSEGDTVKKGDAILSISNEVQRLAKQNAELMERYSDFNANQDKLNEAKQLLEVAKSKLKNDSALYVRQKNLWDQQVGTKVELEQRALAFQNSSAAFYSASVKYKDLKRQLDLSSEQSKNNLQISAKQESDFTLKSEMDGVVYSLLKEKGELVGPQTPLAIIGAPNHFILEMQVDEYDIFKLTPGLMVLVTMDSYKGKVFEAKLTRIYPYMNERSKTFLVEAEFVDPPARLFPNITFEANIVLNKKDKALLVPRNYVLHDSLVVLANGDKVPVKTGLKDYQQIEILSGITENDELMKPTE